LALTSFGTVIHKAAAIFEMVIESEKLVGSLLTDTYTSGAILFAFVDWLSEKKGGGVEILIGISMNSIP
jgi:zinc transporter, ZIP family